MGFNNWARFQCNLNENLFTQTADAMLDKGLLAAGYNNINLDDCWHVQTGRNAKGELQWNSTLFPHGMPWLGDYLHDRGFNFGIGDSLQSPTLHSNRDQVSTLTQVTRLADYIQARKIMRKSMQKRSNDGASTT